jgi:hypothetical protein
MGGTPDVKRRTAEQTFCRVERPSFPAASCLLLNKVRIKVRDLLSDVVKQADWDLDKLLEVEVFVHRSWSSKIIVQHMREPDTMSFKVWCLARTGTTPHGRWRKRRSLLIGVAFRFLNRVQNMAHDQWIDGWIHIQFNRTDEDGGDAVIELIK